MKTSQNISRFVYRNLLLIWPTLNSYNNNNNGEFLYSAHTMLCALHTNYPWSLHGPVHSCTISTPFLEHTALAAISALGTSRTHCHLCPTRYSFTPELSEACEGKVPYSRTQHRNNVPILRGEKHENSENPAPSGIRNRTAGSDIGYGI